MCGSWRHFLLTRRCFTWVRICTRTHQLLRRTINSNICNASTANLHPFLPCRVGLPLQRKLLLRVQCHSKSLFSQRPQQWFRLIMMISLLTFHNGCRRCAPTHCFSFDLPWLWCHRPSKVSSQVRTVTWEEWVGCVPGSLHCSLLAYFHVTVCLFWCFRFQHNNRGRPGNDWKEQSL